jgi:hypothetical protein
MPAYNRTEVTQTGVGNSAWQPMDYAQNPFSVTLDVIVSGTVTYTVITTNDNVQLPGFVPGSANPGPAISALTAKSAAAQATLGPQPTVAVQLQVSAGTGSATLRIIQGGRRTA